jgi:hypothetical protein
LLKNPATASLDDQRQTGRSRHNGTRVFVRRQPESSTNNWAGCTAIACGRVFTATESEGLTISRSSASAPAEIDQRPDRQLNTIRAENPQQIVPRSVLAIAMVHAFSRQIRALRRTYKRIVNRMNSYWIRLPQFFTCFLLRIRLESRVVA